MRQARLNVVGNVLKHAGWLRSFLGDFVSRQGGESDPLLAAHEAIGLKPYSEDSKVVLPRGCPFFMMCFQAWKTACMIMAKVDRHTKRVAAHSAPSTCSPLSTGCSS
jgi:hypothetical protein